RLRPDAEEGVTMLREAIEATPGTYMNRSAFTFAKELADSLPTARRSRRNGDREIPWLLPGDVQDVDAHALPVPEEDRYVFRQAIAVPVGPNTLLVDRQAVYGALTVHVDLGVGKLVQADVPRRWRQRREATDLPVMLLDVPAAAFTSRVDAEAIDDAPPPPPTNATGVQVHAINLLAEMGSVPRVFATEVQAGQGAVTLLRGLAAGEATAPVFDAEGTWLGVQAGKTDPDPEKLVDRFIAIGGMAEVLGNVRSRRRSSRDDDREPIQTDAKVLLVRATHGERFQVDP
ncbi:MAG: hypothetical protein KGY81_06365, partial [Phycisphaerae bacterium]|nr:hypothetical protein [Phycisphaerae bacterium]